MTSQSTDDLVRDLLALHTTRCDDDCPLCLSARAIQELQRDALRWDFFRRTMLNSEARRYSFMRYFDLEPKIAEDLRDPDKAIDEAMQHDLVKRLEDACCCEPDQGFEPCGACKDLGVIERLQRELADRDKTIETLTAELDEASPKRKCDRCGGEFRMHLLIYEEGDELECWPCHDRENARERAAIDAARSEGGSHE